MAVDFLKELSCLVLDMDGTVYCGSRPIGAMQGTLAALRSRGVRLCFFTNNSSKTAEEYAGKLRALGLYDERDVIYTSAMATASYLVAHKRGARVFLLAPPSVAETFREAGVALVSADAADTLVLAYDTGLTFEKLRLANELLVKGAAYIVTHPDLVCPTEQISMPDVGSFIKLLEASSGRTPDVVIGKPNALAGEAILGAVGASAEETAMVGDRLYTDIAFGLAAGFHTILVLSGETDEEMLAASEIRPELVLKDLNAILPLLP